MQTSLKYPQINDTFRSLFKEVLGQLEQQILLTPASETFLCYVRCVRLLQAASRDEGFFLRLFVRIS
jgi:hypothetical protein